MSRGNKSRNQEEPEWHECAVLLSTFPPGPTEVLAVLQKQIDWKNPPLSLFLIFGFCSFFFFLGMEMLGKSFVDLSFILIFFFFSFFLFCYCSFSLVVVGSDRWLIVPRRQLLATPSLRLRFIFLLLHIFCFFLNFF